MSDVVISVKGLGKRYQVAHREPYKTLRDALMNVPARLTRAFRVAASSASSNSAFWALRGVDLDIERGEVLGVIGANGAGKTTLLKILSRITEPTEGQAEIHGRVGSLLEVGTGFHPELTGRENIYLNGAILGMRRSEIDRRFDEIVEFAEVTQFLDMPVKRYSSGMYVRLAFAVAAHLEPEILFVDEVLAVGDVAFQKKCLQKMGDVSRCGRTVLFVSHNMAAVRNLCSRCVWLHRGTIQAIGPTETIVDQYLAHALSLSEMGWRDLSSAEVRAGVQKSVSLNVTFQRIELIDERGETAGVFKEGQPITVRLRWRSVIQTEHLEIFLLVLSMDGAVIFSCHSGHLTGISEDTYQIQMTLPSNPLRPGTYQVRLYLRTGQWQDIIREAIRFRIEAVPDQLINSTLGDAGLWGLVHVPNVWSGPEPVAVAESPDQCRAIA